MAPPPTWIVIYIYIDRRRYLSRDLHLEREALKNHFTVPVHDDDFMENFCEFTKACRVRTRDENLQLFDQGREGRIVAPRFVERSLLSTRRQPLYYRDYWIRFLFRSAFCLNKYSKIYFREFDIFFRIFPSVPIFQTSEDFSSSSSSSSLDFEIQPKGLFSAIYTHEITLKKWNSNN